MAGHASIHVSQAIGEPRTTDGTINWDLGTDVQKNLMVPQRIHRLDRAVAGAPILGLQTRMGGPRTVGNVIYYALRTRRLRDYITTTSTTFTATATTLSFAAADTALLLPGFHIINLNTREVMMVSAVGSTSITVERGVGGVAGTAQDTSADVFMILGYSGAEGDTKFFGLSTFPETWMNYIGELQDTYSLTQFAYDQAMMPGAESPQAKERTEHMDNMRMCYEKRSFFDQKSKRQRTLDNKTVYTPDALDAICTSNEKDFGGDLTIPGIMEWGEDLSRYGGDEVLILASPKWCRKLSIALSGLQTIPNETLRRAGLNVRSFDAGGIVMRVIKHPLFYDDPSTQDDALSGYAYAIPPNDFQPVTMRGRMTGWFRWMLNVQQEGDRLHQDQLYCNYGYMYSFSEMYGRSCNVGS